MQSNSTSDAFNRNEYRRSATIETIRSREGRWIDRGERLILNEIADEFRGQPVLDIGIGAGRTAWLLPLLSDKYVGIELSPEMVEICRQEHPGLDIREADARDLSAFASNSFNLAYFSFNGIDLLGRDDRMCVIKEVQRILKPGGLLLYSTSNRNGRLYDLRPWNVIEPMGLRYLVRFLLRFPTSLTRYWRSYRNWWQKRQYAEHHGSWAICTSRAYEFGCVLHWTRPSTEREALLAAAFPHCEFRNPNGQVVTDDSTTCSYFYVMARKATT